MTPLLSALSVFATAPPILITIAACVSLLGLRAWAATTGLELSRKVFLLVDGAITVLLVLFVGLVAMRFLTGG
jgi:hypothetical protein